METISIKVVLKPNLLDDNTINVMFFKQSNLLRLWDIRDQHKCPTLKDASKMLIKLAITSLFTESTLYPRLFQLLTANKAKHL